MMANDRNVTELLLEVPVAQRQRILSGMRWAVWLSAISLPFSYGTTILLARTSPEALGTYGLLNVYIGVVLGLFYLGGDPVVIKYLPELSNKRLSFLVSYFVVICVATIPWLAVAATWRSSGRFLLGERISPSFQFFILCLAPLVVLDSLVAATLKAALEFAWAHAILRMVTIGSFAVFATIYLSAPSLLAHSYSQIIWGTYFVLCILSAAIGLQRLLHVKHWRRRWPSLQFFLPPGFWRYTFSLQQLSALGFLTQRLDAILVLNFGDLALLGEYVAVVTLAESIRLISRFFTDTLLSSLTNMLAMRNLKAASDVFHTHMRILLLVNTASTCGLILIARPIIAVLGGRYANLGNMVILLALCVGLSTPGGVGGTLLSSIGKQQRAVWVAMIQVAIYVGLFLFFWPRWHLLGAVVAYGIGWLVANFVLLLVARISSPFPFSITRDYVVFAFVAFAATYGASVTNLSLVEGLAAWTFVMLLFLFFAKYRREECKTLIQCFTPFLVGSSASKSSA